MNIYLNYFLIIFKIMKNYEKLQNKILKGNYHITGSTNHVIIDAFLVEHSSTAKQLNLLKEKMYVPTTIINY